MVGGGTGNSSGGRIGRSATACPSVIAISKSAVSVNAELPNCLRSA
jgi:hypothetical protein